VTLYRMIACALMACAVAVITAQPRDVWGAQGKNTARVHGRVVAADTGAVVRGAMVTLTTSSGLRVVATTDDRGEFDFRDLPSSGISLKVTKAGFVETSAPMSVPLQPLMEGQTVDRGDVRIVRGAVIAGRVLDASGEPISGATVNALRVAYPVPGNRQLVAARAAVSTNDLGDYRLYGLAPGTYYVTAGVHRDVTFYPGTQGFAGAQPIIVQGGDQALGINLTLFSERMTSLSGRVVDARGQPAPGLVIELRAIQSGGVLAGRSVVSDQSGRFTIAAVVPGEYRLEASTRYTLGPEVRVVGQPLPMRTQVNRSSDEPPESASVPVTVPAGVESISDLVIQTRVGSELRGRVLVDGGIPSAGTLGSLRIAASPFDTDGHQLGPAPVEPDGTFAFRGLIGRVRISTSGAPQRATLFRVLANGLDVTDDGVDMDRGHVLGVEVHMTTTPTLVKGTVTEAEDKPVPANVIVYAENPALWSKPYTRYVVSKHSAAASGFEIAALPPGRYVAVAVAVETIVPDQWADLENLQRLRPLATPFTLAEGQTVTLMLRRR